MIDDLYGPKADPRMLSAVLDFNKQLSDSLCVAGTQSVSHPNPDLEAGLVGAGFVIDLQMDSQAVGNVNPNDIEQSRHFLRLVN